MKTEPNSANGSARRHTVPVLPVEPYARRQFVARLGEDLAVGFLEAAGAIILGRNIRVGRGEIDVVARVGTARVAVEVKTVVAFAGRGDAIGQFSHDKARTVRRSARLLSTPVYRVDLIGVTLYDHTADLLWVPFVA